VKNVAPGSNYHPLSHAAPLSAAAPEAVGRHHLGTTRSIGFGVLTTSDTHTEEEDESGQLVQKLLTDGGQHVESHRLVANSVADIREALDRWFADPKLEAVITIGGTGVSSRDVTIEALAGMGGKSLEGFGDLYRMLSFQEVGPLAVLSRATLFAIHNRPVYAVPGSVRACQLAVEKLILPTVEHLVEELAR
jgi:molybdenum cofactor biosynthesis protein B